MKKLLFIFILISFLVSCKKEKSLPDKGIILDKISNLSTLGTVEYTLSKVILVNHKRWYDLSTRKILMSSKAYVKAGIDFKNIRITEINDSTKSISVILPNPKIILINIPPHETVVLYTKIGTFRKMFSNEDLNRFQIQAEMDIQRKIHELPILDDARKNGKIFLYRFLKNFGFKEINISYENILNN
jgi:hypothetical protein